MPQIDVLIGGQTYEVICDEGRESHVREMAHHIDRHIKSLPVAPEPVSPAQRLMMAGLVVADELSEALYRVETLEQDIESLRQAQRREHEQEVNAHKDKIQAFAQTLEKAGERLESVAARLGDL